MEQLLKKLREQNVVISLNGDDLKVKFNGDGLPPELIQELKENKQQLIKYLSQINNAEAKVDIQPLPQRDSYPLSSSQSRVWVLSQFEGDSHAYNMPGVYVFEGKLQADSLEDSFKALMARHEILRTMFRDDALGEIRQFIYPPEEIEFQLPCEDLRHEEAQESILKKEVQAEIIKPFDLSSKQLLRARLFRMADQKWVFTYVMHHIISDGWSMDILFHELLSFYNTFIKGETPALRPLRIQYKDYAFWQNQQLNGTSLQLHKSWWLEQMKGELPVLALRGDHPRPAVKNYNGGAVTKRVHADLVAALKKLCQQHDATLFMGLLAVVNLLFYRYTGQEDQIIGTPAAGRDHIDLEDQIGLYLNTLPLRTVFSGDDNFKDLLAGVRKVTLGAYEHQVYPFEKLVDDLSIQRDMSKSPLFDVMLMLQNANVRSEDIKQQFGDIKVSGYQLSEHQVSKLDLTFDFVEFGDGLQATLEYNSDIYNQHTATQLLNHLEQILEAIISQPLLAVKSLDYLREQEKEKLLKTFNNTATEVATDQTIVRLLEQQMRAAPDAIALVAEEKNFSWQMLNKKANQVASYLLKNFNIQANDLVGVQLERTEWMLFAMLGILKSGGGYVPIDPAYPQERISYITADSNCITVITKDVLETIQQMPDHDPQVQINSGDLAYCIYTSGTTGEPKGCLLTHANVVNFFSGMNQIFTEQSGTLLALTNNTFDISVLELIWTLTKGYKVVLQKDVTDIESRKKKLRRPLDFSLFYFGNGANDREDDIYKLLIDGAKYADANGYAAVWTPERHFHEFGGLYPNPSVLGAALAAITKNISIRAGSVVLPLHHPLRIAEEWSVVDNLSAGRVGIACASGWHARDFVLSPESYANRHAEMYEKIDVIQRLWKGESIAFEDGKGIRQSTGIFPRPRQKELPIWITSANSIDTFISAGKLGAAVLTHLLGETVDGLAVKIDAYKKAFAESGHDPAKQKVSLMLHTYIGEDLESTYANAREPFMNYLRTSAALMKTFAADLNIDLNADNFSEEDMQSLLEHSFNRYVSSASLIGTKASCLNMLNRLADIGVDEIACLIDFGIAYEQTMQGLENITALKNTYNTNMHEEDYSVHAQLERHQVTHLQATPSMAMLLKTDPAPLRSLKKILLGGERVPHTLVAELYRELPGVEIHNMYGPTETTIWSASARIDPASDSVLIGKPIANTQIYMLDRQMQLLPVGAEGEIYIGGKGVAKGYMNKQSLSAQRFLPDPFSNDNRLYRTGDYGRWLPDGNIEYFGRRDDQVKLHGHRIELGEIEAAILSHALISEAVVLVKESAAGQKDLVAWFVAKDFVSATAIRELLSNKLPGYMVPGQYIQLATLPLTVNGKTDRKKLLMTETALVKTTGQFTEAENEIETKLLEIWMEILERRDIGTTDNFFDLGGNSMKIVRMVMLCNRIFDRKLTVAMAFRFVNIRALAEYLFAGKHDRVGESEQDLERSVDIMDETFSLLKENDHEN